MGSWFISGTAVTVDLDQVWRGLLTLAGVAVILSIALLILKIMGTVKRINRLIEEVSPPVKAVVNQLPQTITHLNNISGNLEDISDEVAEVVPVLLTDVRDTSETAVGLVSSVSDVLTETTGLLTSLLQFLQKPLGTVSRVSNVVSNISRVGSFIKPRKKKKK